MSDDVIIELRPGIRQQQQPEEIEDDFPFAGLRRAKRELIEEGIEEARWACIGLDEDGCLAQIEAVGVMFADYDRLCLESFGRMGRGRGSA